MNRAQHPRTNAFPATWTLTESDQETRSGNESVPAGELTGGVDAGEAFAALGHQIGVTCAVHF